MTTTQEARTQLELRRRELLAQQRNLQALRQQSASKLRTTSRFERQREIQQVSAQEQQLKEYEKQLSGYEQEITQAEQQMAEQEKAQAQAQARSEAFNYAVKVYLGQTSGSQIGNVPEDIRREAQKVAESYERGGSWAKEVDSGKLVKLTPELVKQIETSAIQLPSVTEQSVQVGNIRVPSGYANKEMQNLYSKYYSKIDTRGKTQYEINAEITSNVNYQKDLQGILSKTSTIESMEKYAKRLEYSNPEQYGKQYSVPSILTSSNPLTTSRIISLPSQNILETERQRYRNLGYKSFEVDVLARESTRLGGVTFNPVKAQELINKYIREHPLKALGKDIASSFVSGTPSEQEFQKIVSESTFKELYKSGDYPALVHKTFQKGGSLFFKGTEALRTGIFKETRLGEPTTKAQKEFGGVILGEFFLGVGFSPFMKTGAESLQEQETPWDFLKAKKKKGTQLLQESPFSSLGQELDETDRIASVLSKIEKDVISKKTLKEQLEYLKSLRIRIKSQEALKHFDDFVKKDLLDKDIIKIPKIEITDKGIITTGLPTTKQEILYSIQQPPQMRFAGEVTGIFSSDLEQAFTKQKKEQITYNVTGLKEPAKMQIKEQTKQREKMILGSLTTPKISQTPKTSQIPKTSQMERTLQLSMQRQIQRQTQRQTQRQVQRQVQKQMQKQKQRLGYRKLQLQKRKFLFKLPQLIGGSSLLKIGKAKEEPDIFKVFVKKFGKDVPVGAFGTKQKAEERLRTILKGTARASGFILKGGEKLKATEISFLGEEFRPSKIEPFRVVQKREKRLGTRPEVKEVQYFKKSKKKRIF